MGASASSIPLPHVQEDRNLRHHRDWKDPGLHCCLLPCGCRCSWDSGLMRSASPAVGGLSGAVGSFAMAKGLASWVPPLLFHQFCFLCCSSPFTPRWTDMWNSLASWRKHKHRGSTTKRKLCCVMDILSILKERDRASYATMMLTSLQEQAIGHSEMKFSSSTNHSKFKKAHEFHVLY